MEPTFSDWKESLLFPSSHEAETFWFGHPSSAREIEVSKSQLAIHRGLMLPPVFEPHTAMKIAVRYKDEQSFPLFAPGCGPEMPIKRNQISDQPKAYIYTFADEEADTEAEEEEVYEEVVSLDVELSVRLLPHSLQIRVCAATNDCSYRTFSRTSSFQVAPRRLGRVQRSAYHTSVMNTHC